MFKPRLRLSQGLPRVLETVPLVALIFWSHFGLKKTKKIEKWRFEGTKVLMVPSKTPPFHRSSCFFFKAQMAVF